MSGKTRQDPARARDQVARSAAGRVVTGAAVLQPGVTVAITEAVLDELVDNGYGRLSMEAVARRAGVGKSALYRRWPSKQDMVLAVLSGLGVPPAAAPDTGSLRGDLRAALTATHHLLAHPRLSKIFADLIAEGMRVPALAAAVHAAMCDPRRDLAAVMVRRAVARGELPADVDSDLALDLLAAAIYWRVVVRATPVDSGYLDRLADHVLRALRATAETDPVPCSGA